VQEFDKRSAVPVCADAEPEELRPVLAGHRQRELIALEHYRSLSEQDVATELTGG
jgi:hypothetical protein